MYVLTERGDPALFARFLQVAPNTASGTAAELDVATSTIVYVAGRAPVTLPIDQPNASDVLLAAEVAPLIGDCVTDRTVQAATCTTPPIQYMPGASVTGATVLTDRTPS